ncbi:MAG: ABC transporter ATP-binding protein/permease [Planctomycetes bacterium]|nr:ABC transporter ATP-binding protein/permease [Planctomycetota bacterium]
MSILSLPRILYESFIRDSVRLHRVLDGALRWRFWGIFALQITLAIVEALTILIIAFFTLSVSSPDTAMNSVWIRRILSLSSSLQMFCESPRNFIIFTSILMMAFIVAKNSITATTLFSSNLFAEIVSLNIVRKTIRRFFAKDYFWHLSPESGDVLFRMSTRTQLSTMIVLLLQLYSNIICSLALFISLFLAEPKLTLLVVSVFSIVGSTIYLALHRRIDSAGAEVHRAAGEEGMAMGATVQGMREVLLYRRQKVFYGKIVDAIRASIRPRVFLGISGAIPSWLLETAGFGVVCSVIISMIRSGDGLPRIITAMSMLMLTAWRVLPFVSRIVANAIVIRGIRPAALQCLSLLESFIQEATEPALVPNPDFTFHDSIEFRDVGFSYPTASYPALVNISFSIRKGERVGLIGLSGAGKSTLAYLLSGLLKPHTGEIIVDGRVCGPNEGAAWLERVAFVPQVPFLMGGTIGDNVMFGRWGEQVDKEDIERVCRLAAMDFVFDDPAGLNRIIGPNGGGLSGGQSQRVAIARALFVKPEVVIFDEATSALDQAGENTIKQTIDTLPEHLTCIIIAHRLSTVEECDKLFWLEKGAIRTSGTPAEVLPQYLQSMKVNPSDK